MDGSGTADEVDPLTVTQRFQREGRWKDIELERNDIMKAARKQGMDKAEAQLWVYGELDRMYPPPKKADTVLPDKDVRNRDDGQIQGLGAIPADWPELPANASLAAEIAWCQANRLQTVSERSSGATIIDLGQALSPAPSWAALGWLETTVRSYAKFVDVAARVSGQADDEHGMVRRERVAIDEVREEMDAGREAPPA